MYLTLIFLPAVTSICAGLLGRKLGSKGSQFISCIGVIITTILSLIAFYEVSYCNSPCTINLFSWIDLGIIDISWNFIFDSLTCSMLLAVTIVSMLVHIFSIDYISQDPHQQRFFSYLSIFTFFILILCTGDNYLVIFVGWEGIGISSFLLINFWFTRIQASKSGIKALTVNRVGDIFLSIAFFIIFYSFGNLDYSTVFSLQNEINEDVVTIIGLLLLFAAIGKSAQLGLHVWLPDAMEGPTPVSALIHAATLVTAGVYLLLRSSPIIEYSSTVLLVITFVGSITSFFAASTGLFQNDLKRVIAYSTCSQIGYLFIACGLSQYSIALFHLVNHAFFKALLFLSAGAVLHACNDQQDQRRLGGIIGFLPFSYQCIIIGSLSLIALPFITGFYSKDLILEVCYSQYLFQGQIAYYLGTISAFITAFYSLRLISITFLTYPNANRKTYENTHEASNIVIIPLIILSVLAIFFGYFIKDIFVGIGTDFLSESLFIHPQHIYLVETEFALNIFYKILPLFATIIGISVCLFIYHYQYNYSIDLRNSNYYRIIYKFFQRKYYVDIIYNRYIIYPALNFGYTISKIIDKGWIEFIGPYGIEKGLEYQSKHIAKLDTGNLTSYALYITISLIVSTFFLFICIIWIDIDMRIFIIILALSCFIKYRRN